MPQSFKNFAPLRVGLVYCTVLSRHPLLWLYLAPSLVLLVSCIVTAQVGGDGRGGGKGWVNEKSLQKM